MIPHGFGLDALIKKGERVRQTALAEPCGLGYPLLDLSKVELQDLGGKVGDEGFGYFAVVGVIALG